jgi:RES domain-containing protein
VASEAPTLLGTGPVSEVAFRWTSYDVPFWARPNSRSGRWNRAGEEPTQYWSLDPEAAWAELIRHENLTSEEELDLVRMPFWVCRIPAARLIDLRRPEERERHGVADDDLIDDDWSACQALAATLRPLAAGVIAPCAALPTKANVTLFGARRAIAWDRPPALASAVSATRGAIGRPPPGLVGRVRRPLGPPALGRLF